MVGVMSLDPSVFQTLLSKPGSIIQQPLTRADWYR